MTRCWTRSAPATACRNRWHWWTASSSRCPPPSPWARRPAKLDELLATISETLDFEAEVATKRLVTLLEPIMIVIMGLIVAFVVVAVILPIYQSYGTIGQSSSTY